MVTTQILIADDKIEFCALLQEHLQSQPDMSVIGCVHNGNEALRMVETTHPDVILLDLVMPHMDGIGVLERMQSLNYNPRVIIMSALGRETIAQESINLGANYFLLKPFDLDVLVSRIRQVAQTYTGVQKPASIMPSYSTTAATIQKEVSDVLHSLGVPAHIKGYQYLRDSIVHVIGDMELLSAVTKILYPKVAKLHNTSANRVERAMRHAIELAWSRGDREVKKRFFGYTLNIDQGKPTNSEFIALVSEQIRLGIQRNH